MYTNNGKLEQITRNETTSHKNARDEKIKIPRQITKKKK